MRIEVDDGGPPTQEDSPLVAVERELIAKPEDYAAWQVYADMLASAGDPRGELITIGVALARGEGTPDEAQLRAREDELLQANASAWFGELASDDDWRECFGWTLQTGFWGRIRLWVDYDHSGTDLGKVLAYALAHPSAKFVRQIDLGMPSGDGQADYSACVRALVRHGPLPSLRRLTIGDFEFPDETEISWVHVGDVGPLWPALTGIESLHLRGGGIGLGTPKSATLRSLELWTGGLPAQAGASLGRAELPALEHLVVWFGTTYYGGSCDGGHVRAILDNPSLTRLRHLALANADFGDEVARAVAGTRLPASLRTLDLSMGTMTDAGAELLLAGADALRGLDRVDLSRNCLSEDMCVRLRAALRNVDVDEQKSEDERYVSVGE